MFLRAYYKKILRKEKGAILAMTAVMIPIMFGFAGLAFDVGNLYLQKGKLQHIADAAAYAGSSVYYKDMLSSMDNNQKPNADYVVNDTNTGVVSVSESHNNRRVAADNAAAEYINKNKPGVQSEILALEGQVPVKAEGSSGSATTTSDGVLYRVRVSEEFPLYFLRLIPGISNTQTVSADAVVAFTRGDSNKATESLDYESEYVNIFKNLFTTTNLSTGKDNNNNEMDFAPLSSKIQGTVQTAEILDQYSYMIYMDNRSTSTYVLHNSTTLNAGNSTDKFYSGNSYTPYNKTEYQRTYNSTLNGYYHPWDTRYNGKDYEYRRYHADVYLAKELGQNETKYVININHDLNDYTTKGGEKVPFYLYKRYAGNIEINVKDEKNNYGQIVKKANTKENCFPIILVNRNQYIGPDYNNNSSVANLYNETITVNIDKDRVFRGLIFAPYSTVTINIDQGTFKGGVVANKVIVNGTGTFTQENYFTESDGSDAWWIKSFIPESDTAPYVITNDDGTKTFNRSTTVLLNYFFNTYLKDMTYNLAREDGHGNKLSTWYTWVYETLKVGGNYNNGFGSEYQRSRKNGGYIDLSVSGTQNWFENLDTLSKARLAREWTNFIETYKGYYLTYYDEYGRKQYYKDEDGNEIQISSISLPWVWSSNAAIHKEKEQEQEEVIKSYMMISSDSNSNLFKKFDL